MTPPLSGVVAEAVRRNRRLWGGICWIVAVVPLVFGAFYTVLGHRATAAPGAFSVMVRWLPGDLRTFGVVLLTVALLMIHGLLPPLHGRPMLYGWLHRLLRVVAGFSTNLVWIFAWSWVMSGTPAWQGMTLWGVEGALALLAARNEPSDHERHGRAT